MKFDVLFWIVMIGLAIAFVSMLSLTFFVRSRYAQALHKIASGKPQEALDLLKRVVGWQDRHVPSLWNLALLHLSMDKLDAAVRDLQRILKIMNEEPNKVEAAARWEVAESQVVSQLAWTLSKLNKRPEAIVGFRRLIELEPNNKEARNELARLYYVTRDYDQAIPMLESVIQLDPTHAEAFETLSHALSAKGDHIKAAEVLARRLVSDRTNVNLWIRMANLYRTAKDNVRQAEAWRVVIEITPESDPNHLSARVQIGKLAYLDKKYQEAINLLEAAAGACPREDSRTLKSVMYYIGQSHLALDRKAEARAAFTEVYELDRNYKDIRTLLKESYEVLKDDDLTEELRSMRIDDFSALAAAIVETLGYRPTSVETVNEADVRINAKLEETGKDRPALFFFQRGIDGDVGELSIRSFNIECDERHVEYPYFFSTGGFSFEAQIKAKDYRMNLMPKREFCELIRKVRTAAVAR